MGAPQNWSMRQVLLLLENCCYNPALSKKLVQRRRKGLQKEYGETGRLALIAPPVGPRLGRGLLTDAAVTEGPSQACYIGLPAGGLGPSSTS